MTECRSPRGCDRFFGARFAARLARQYRKSGLDQSAKQLVDFLEQRGIRDATVLEVGGGVGVIQIELLRRGAAGTVNLEISPGYEDQAQQLLAEAGLADRAVRHIHDIAADPAGVEPADVVVLHRVVCCYPDYERLLTAAADHARRLLVFSYPPRNAASRFILGTENLIFRLLRWEFRVFNHPPAAMLAVLERRGLRPTYTGQRAVWRVTGLERTEHIEPGPA
jgi:2-polyprenyl-3-methyl-5-hydroxy-6-metoxy-1,4-benzoquinol methylase